MRILRGFFRLMNKFFMVPMFRLGLGSLVGNPITGYIMVLKMRGRKTGKLRYVPVNYAILDGCVYCISGFGKRSHWMYNLQADPHLELILPGGAIAGMAEDATQAPEGLRALRQVLKNSGIVGLMAGLNAFTITDEKLQEKAGNYPILRIRPAGIGSGAADAGGWLWALFLALTIVIPWLIWG